MIFLLSRIKLVYSSTFVLDSNRLYNLFSIYFLSFLKGVIYNNNSIGFISKYLKVGFLKFLK